MRLTPNFKRWWKKQYIRQDAYCYYCLLSFKNRRINVEHVVPMSRGGTNKKKNMVLSCASCNKAKGSMQIPMRRRKQLHHRLMDNMRPDKASDLSYQIDLSEYCRRIFVSSID